MRFKKRLILLLFVSLGAMPSFGQMTEDPTAWSYTLKKIKGHDYQVTFHLDLKDGWHIWSLHPGGDGYEIAPSFVFDKNPKLKVKGKVAENGKATSTTMEGIEGKVSYLSGKIDYTQNITVTGSTRFGGKLTYQVCNDKLCLPPKDKTFKFEVE